MIEQKRTESGKLVTVYYTHWSVNSLDSAVELILHIASLDRFRVDYIALRDLEKSSDEGNASREFPAGTDADEILDACRKERYQRIFLSGCWDGARLGVGIDLSGFEVAVTGFAGDQDRIDSLARLL